MINKLEELGVQKQYISVYMNRNTPTNFVYGRVLCVDERFMVFYMIAPNGKYDGVLVKETYEIFRIEEYSQYSEKMYKLIDKQECDKFPFVLECHNLVKSMLQIAKDTEKIVSIELVNSEMNDVIGFVENIDGDLCTIKQIRNVPMHRTEAQDRSPVPADRFRKIRCVRKICAAPCPVNRTTGPAAGRWCRN